MNSRKPTWLLALLGTLLGAVLMGLIAPSAIAWYFTPPVDLTFNCKPAIEWGLDTFRKSMIFGAIAGCIGGLIIARLLNRKEVTPQ